MTKASGFSVLLIMIFSLLIFFTVKNWYDEKQLTSCIENILSSQQIGNIQATIKNRGKKPILKGMLTQEKKQELLEAINNHCQVTEIQDFIETVEQSTKVSASLNFRIDYVNNILFISGLVKNQQQVDNILDSFKTAIKDNFPPSDIGWTLTPDISIDNNAQTPDYDIYITLLFTAIGNIRLTDITLEGKQLVLKGLVRDKIREDETLSSIKNLFDDEFSIVNQLELVVALKPNIQNIEFEPIAPPIFDKLK